MKEIEIKTAEIQKKYGDVNPYSLSKSEYEQRGQYILDELKKVPVDHTMEYNSINPEFRSIVHNLIHYLEDDTVIYNFYDFSVTDYTEDLECGKKLHQDHSDKLYKFIEKAYGKEFADKRQDAIKSALYG